jgi:hypothetical protein
MFGGPRYVFLGSSMVLEAGVRPNMVFSLTGTLGPAGGRGRVKKG